MLAMCATYVTQADLSTILEDRQLSLPQAFILGAAKSSTTTLWGNVRMVATNLCFPEALEGDPKWYRKEGTFFSVDGHFNGQSPVVEEFIHYASRYPRHKCMLNGVFLDATPSYISHAFAPERLRYVYQHANIGLAALRFVVLLREPAARDKSWFSIGNDPRARAAQEMCLQQNIPMAECYHRNVLSEKTAWLQCASRALGDVKAVDDHLTAVMLSNRENILRTYRACHDSSRLAHGIYISQLLSWFMHVPRQQLGVYQSTYFTSSGSPALISIMKHLNISYDMTRWMGIAQENLSSEKKHYRGVRSYLIVLFIIMYPVHNALQDERFVGVFF